MKLPNNDLSCKRCKNEALRKSLKDALWDIENIATSIPAHVDKDRLNYAIDEIVKLCAGLELSNQGSFDPTGQEEDKDGENVYQSNN